MKNICLSISVLALTATAWAQFEGAPDVRFSDEKPKVVQHNPSTAPTDEEWIFNLEKARKLQKDAAAEVGVPVELTLSLGDKTKLKLVLVPGGTFNMGSPRTEKYRGDDELRHRVTVTRPFYMGVHEVTQEQWEQIMGKNHSQFHGGLRPVENVTYDEAVTFCYKVSQRTGRKVTLPSESQWEWACRAGTNTPYSTGNFLDWRQASFDGTQEIGKPTRFTDQHKKGKPQTRKGVGLDRQCTTFVGQFKPNGFGLYDMHGNVYEWCSDWYDEGYYNLSPQKDPQGPPEGKLRVCRGGSWGTPPWDCASARRHKWEPDTRTGQFGLRVIVTDIDAGSTKKVSCAHK